MAVRTMVKLGMLAALSTVLVWLCHFPILPVAPWMEYDPADIPILIAGFFFGPVPGLLLTIVVSLIQAFLLGGNAIAGFIMHTVATGAMVLVAGSIYRWSPLKKTRKGAAVALIAGALTMVLVMIPLNLIVTPIFMGAPRQSVIDLLLPAIVPFNAIKAGINCVVTFLLYKPLSKLMRRF